MTPAADMQQDTLDDMLHSCAGTLRAFFRGNGANVVKIAPETALKLTFNDKMKVGTLGCRFHPADCCSAAILVLHLARMT